MSNLINNIPTTEYGRPLNPFERRLYEKKEAREGAKAKKPLNTQIHIFKILEYVILLVVVISVYDFLRNHFMMLALVLVAAFPVLDIISFIFMYRNISVELDAPERDVTRNTVNYLKLRVKNGSIFVSYDVRVKLDAENSFYGDKSGAVLSLPAPAMDTFEKYIPMKYSMNGIYRFTVGTLTIRDLLGFTSLKKSVDVSTEVNVFPEDDVTCELELTDMTRGMTESEETVKKGHDFSDVSDVREYIPGDKLMSIHWKLSAKRDVLMVKDRVSMSDQQMVILVELAGEDEVVDEVISFAYAVVNRFIQDQTYVRLMWWSDAGFAFEERQIMNKENLHDAFSDMYYEKTYPDGDKTLGYMRSIRPELKAYVRVCMRAGEPDAVVVEQE